MTKIYFQKKASICLKKSKEKVRKQKTKCDTIELTWESRKLICKIEKWEEAYEEKVIAIVCAVAVLAAAGGGAAWHFLGNSTKEDDNVVYVNTVKALTNLGTGNGMENRYAGVVESENTWKVEKTARKR